MSKQYIVDYAGISLLFVFVDSITTQFVYSLVDFFY